MTARFKVGIHVTYTDTRGEDYHGVIINMDCNRHPNYPIEVTFENRRDNEIFTLDGRYNIRGDGNVRLKLREKL